MTRQVQEIGRVEFGLFSPEEIRQYSVAEIQYAEPYENHLPKQGGLLDPRLGCIDRHIRCLTCDRDMNDCPGHFGHIELARPVYHVSYIEKIKKVLECVCPRCARLRFQKKESFYRRLITIRSPKSRFNNVWKYCKSRLACEYPDCGYQIVPVRRQGGDLYMGRGRNRSSGDLDFSGRKPISPSEVHSIFCRISDQDCMLMGLDPKKARPEWMILTVLPVPPPCVRPSVSMGSGSRGEDDLTYKLTDIIRYNKLIQNCENDPTNRSLEEYEIQLQFHVSTYFDNDTSLYVKSTQKGGRPIKSISSRICGKNGRIRGHCMGKRVDFTARTVITGDPNLSIEQVGVPYEIAMNLTFPECVTKFNRERLQKFVENGPKQYPGATYVIKASGEKIDLSFAKAKPLLKIGDTVERHLVDNDLAMFNRQPTLHKMSMMAHKVRVMSGKTFRLNLSVTTPYNADFDGDEMNLHICQNYEAVSELSTLSKVSQLVVSPQSNKPVMGIVQDALCGVRKFTLRDTFICRDKLYNLLLKLPHWDGIIPPPAIIKPKPLWTGKQFFSLLLPKTLNYSGYHSTHPDGETGFNSPGDTRVIIEKGQLLSGIICKKSVGTSQGSIIHIIWQDYGPDAVRDFFDGCQFIINEWLLHHGFSVGLGDCLTDSSTQKQISETVQTALDKVDNLINSYKYADASELENMINSTLSRARDASGKVAAASLPSDNNFKQMVHSGSKGSYINISQIAATVGQQNVEGGRVPFGFRNRSLPYFAKFDQRPEAKGFVKNSYIKGLRPTEFFFHAMGGREGLIDTACKSVTGNTPIVIIEEGQPKYVQIGDWIDGHLDKRTSQVKHYEQHQMELLELTNNVYIPTTDAHGNVTWGKVTAVTRHDPGKELFEITTFSGRRVIVTESKSLLVWDTKTLQFVEKNTPDVRVGDHLPTTMSIPKPPYELDHVCNDNFNFKLSYENGIFIGLILASNSSYSSNSSNVKISTMYSEVTEFAKSWFEMNSIVYDVVYDDDGPICFTIITGMSSQLARFLEFFVGSGSDKHFPDVAFTANELFVTGLLNGYFSCRTITPYSVIASSFSEKLVEGMSFLCNRFGIFCKRFSAHCGMTKKLCHSIGIYTPGVERFAEKIPLLVKHKQKALNKLKCVRKHRTFSYDCVNDIVLDKITSIQPVPIDLYPKVYDLTVPSTLNFGLANGLQVRDTAETGYIQRRLVKALEDVVVAYDGTVRTTNGLVLQFQYGEDGMDATSIERQNVYLITMNNEAICKELSDIPQEQEQLVKDREYLRKVFPSFEPSMQVPLQFRRLLQRAKTMFGGEGGRQHDATIVYQQVQHFLSNLPQRFPLFDILVRYFFASKSIIRHYKLDREAFNWCLEQVRQKFAKGHIDAGEGVGVLAAQSIGEPTTQMTLNSVEWDTEIILCVDGQLQRWHIGDFIDKKMTFLPVESYPNDTKLCYLKDTIVTVPSCDENGKLHWKRVEALTKHPVINKDGSNTLLKVSLKSGRTVVATKAKSFLVRQNNKILPIDGDQLQVGDYLPVTKKLDLPVKNNDDPMLTFDNGMKLGMFLSGMRNLPTDLHDKFIDEQRLSSTLLNAPIPFVRGILNTLFLRRSHFEGPYELLLDLQYLFSRIKITTMLRNGKLSMYASTVIPNVLLSRNRKLCATQSQLFSILKDDFELTTMDKTVLSNCLEEDILYDQIISIEEVPSKWTYVYDLTVEDTRNFSAYNGIALRDTFHFSGINNVLVSSGVPRLKELINTVKNIKAPSMTIYLEKPYCDSREVAEKIAKEIKHVTLHDILDKSEIFYDIDPLNCVVDSDQHWVRLFWSIPDCTIDVGSLNPWLLRLVIRRDKLHELELSMQQLVNIIENTFENDLFCYASDDNESELAIHIRIEKDNEEVDNQDSNITGDVFLQQIELNLMEQLIVKGIPGIDLVTITEKKVPVALPDGGIEEKKEYFLETLGINLQAVMFIDGVDLHRLYCNDPMEMYATFGIESARQCLLKEIRKVIEFDGSYVNYRHIALLCDVMTNRGQIMSITRHGINRLDSGPLKKCTFEETQDVLMDAALNAEVDYLQGVSENVLLGKLIPGGTGVFDVYFDEEMMSTSLIDN